MIELRPYQTQLVNETHAAIRAGARRVLVCAPTGSGKRYIGCWWAAKIAEKGKRLLVVTDRKILVKQMADECHAAGIEHGILMGSEPRNESAKVQIASLQTLVARGWRDVPQADWVIHDEAHKSLSASRRLQTARPGCVWVGFSATPVGPKGLSLVGSHYDRMIEPTMNSWLINEGWLLRTKVWYACEPDTRKIGVNPDGEWNQTQLGERVRECVVFANIFEWWGKYSALQSIAFCPGVAHARWLAAEFTRRGHAAAVVEAGTSTADRRDCFAAFSEREIRILCSCDVLREGFDSPIAQCGIDLQPNRQLRTYWQKIGRVKRPHEGQEHAVWLDFAGNFWRFPHPDEDPQWPSDAETTTQDLIKKKRETEKKEPWSCPTCAYSLSPWEKIHDGKCPSCGAPIRKAVRRIRMADGSMKTTSAAEKKQVQRTEAEKQHRRKEVIWKSCLKQAAKRGWSLRKARSNFYYLEKTMPHAPDYPFCPPNESGDWNRKVSEVFPQLIGESERTLF